MEMNIRSMGLLMFLIVLMAGLVLMTGCIDGLTGDSGDGGSDDAEPGTSSEPGATVKDEGETKSTNPPKDEGSGGIPFADIFNLGVPKGYVVSYDITVNDGETKTTMKQTHNVKGDKMRMDMKNYAEGVDGEMRIYSISKEVYICTKVHGVWTCLGGKSSEGVDDSSDTSFSEEQLSLFENEMDNLVYDGTQVIVGVVAQCYKLRQGDESVRICVHPNKYINLLTESGDYRMVATSVSLVPPADSVFELPAEPVDLSGGIGSDPCAFCALIPDEDAKADCLANC
ncbi:MAG: hypothetical protein U9Q22_07330 [Candidatus Altiarchaeota archaeon]|nr:hypothetical protein [Candidatus Altiarchaeota archaeon]